MDSNQIAFGVTVKRVIAMTLTAKQVLLKDWQHLLCSCMKCLPTPRAVEGICCSRLSEVKERLEGSDRYVTCLETFKILCLDKDVLYTVLVTRHTVRGDKVQTVISNK